MFSHIIPCHFNKGSSIKDLCKTPVFRPPPPRPLFSACGLLPPPPPLRTSASSSRHCSTVWQCNSRHRHQGAPDHYASSAAAARLWWLTWVQKKLILKLGIDWNRLLLDAVVKAKHVAHQLHGMFRVDRWGRSCQLDTREHTDDRNRNLGISEALLKS